MSRIRAIAITSLLLPGLALAAPIAGACGPCDRGEPCAAMRAPEPVQVAHGCCGDSGANEPGTPRPSSGGTKACDCGRHAPPAIATDAVVIPESGGADIPVQIATVIDSERPVTQAASARPPAPPPTRSIFLVDCAFLT